MIQVFAEVLGKVSSFEQTLNGLDMMSLVDFFVYHALYFVALYVLAVYVGDLHHHSRSRTCALNFI